MYKVTLFIPGVALFRLYGLEDIPTLSYEINKSRYALLSKAAANKEKLILLSQLLIKYDKNLWSKRIESNCVDIYTNSEDLFNELLTTMEDVITGSSAPDECTKNILESTGSIIAKKLPHDRYHFKVFLAPHKIKDIDEKAKYLQWIDQQGSKILISETVKKWFIATSWNWDRRYILVEDESTLLMLKLRNSDALGRIYDYIISDK